MKLVRKLRNNVTLNFLSPSTLNTNIIATTTSSVDGNVDQTTIDNEHSSENVNEDTQNSKSETIALSLTHDESRSESPTQLQSQSQSLSLMHLKKLFKEFLELYASLNKHEKREKLLNLLPLFCKVFGVRSNGDILEKFDDAVNFCRHLTKLFIEEIQSRASNQKSGDASQILFDFLRIHKNNSKECNHGWLMLSSFFIFAYNHQTFVEIMIENSLPSTMVKCLYLFLDLPSSNEDDCQESILKNSQYEDTALFQSTFHKLLIKLCGCRLAAEDLITNDVLILLFHAVTTWCSNENLIWRKSASDVLTTVSRYGLTLSVINNIHNKNSMSICIENLYHFLDINILEIVDMLLTLFCFLKDSCGFSPVLLEDFKNAKGYVFLEDFLLSFEEKYHNDESKVHDVMRHMIQRIACLVTYGYNDIKVTKDSNSFMYKLPGFLLPKSRNDSTTVRNISAFKVLHSCFFKTKSVFLSCVILDSISNIFNSDYANYFLLENHRILPQLIECVHLKSDEVQLKIFGLVEFLVFELKYIPFKEFISMVIFLRTHVFDVPKCGQFCMNTLIAIIAADPIFKKIFREVGLIEVCITCLQYFHDLIEKNHESKDSDENNFLIWNSFGPIILNCVRLMLCNSEDNIEIFNKYSGTKLIQEFIQYDSYRIFALEVIHELIISSSKSETELTFLLNSLNNSFDDSIEAKNQILICLIFCLKNSHRVRIWFRKNDGFLNVLNILMRLDNYLTKEKISRDIIIILRNIFRTISIAMKDEPGNSKYFFTNFCVTRSFRDILKCLKCFSTNIEDNNNMIVNEKYSNEFQNNPENYQYFQRIFSTIDPNNFQNEISFNSSLICVILRLLHDLLLEKFKSISYESLLSLFSPGAINKQFRIIDLNSDKDISESLIIHPGILIIMFELIISIRNYDNVTMDLKLFLSNNIKLLLRSERNQQIICQNGFVDKILTLSECILTDECDPLHNIYQSIFERLATQFCNSKDLRRFFRLGQPLFCLPIDSLEQTGGTVSLSRLKSLVSMATPKDLFRDSFMNNSSSFIEFNMSINGYAALFFPSLAPQIQISSNVLTAAVNDSTTILLGNGSGYAVRMFPPQIGFSFSTWFYIDKFSDIDLDPHPVRLLNIFKTTNSKQNSESHICFSVFLSCKKKAIIISSLELNMSEEKNLEFLTPNEYLIRVPYSNIREKMWHHLVVVLNRSVLRNSTLFLYLNGELIHSQSIIYMCQTNMHNANNNTNISLFAYIGTPYAWRKISNLCWRQGHCFLFEEVLLAQTVSLIYKLGPSYIGSLQAVRDDSNEHDISLVTEEKISFGINPLVESEMNLSKIKKIYNRNDYKTIVKHLNLSTNDHLLTVRILHNTAAHLPGPIRTLGGVTIGYLSCRIFKPQPVTNEINSIGGSIVLLGLIAMSQNADSLYAAVKSLVCIVKANYTIQQEMEKNNYYQMLSMLLQRKSKMLNSHVLNLIFSLVGTNDIGRESPMIPNQLAFQYLLCNFEIWNDTNHDLLKSLFENIYEIVILEKNDNRRNLQLMREMKMVEKIIHLITHLRIKNDTLNIIHEILIILLKNNPFPYDLLNFGQFIVSLLLDKVHIDQLNWSLKIIYSILIEVNESTIVANAVICEEIIQTLGFDWILLFFNQGLDNSTVIIAMKILLVILSIPNMLIKFRENDPNKCWINISKFKSPIGLLPTSIDSTIQQSTQFRNSTNFVNYQIDLSIPNFDQLNLLLIKNINLIEIYPLLLNLIMGQTAGQNQLSNLDLDQVWSYLCIDSKRDQIRICPEAISILLTMTQFLINNSTNFKKNSFFIEQPIAIIQLLFAFYQNIPEFSNIFMTTSLVTNLAKILFPLHSISNYTKLIDHPVYFHVINFIKIIIIDSFNISINNNSKNIPIIDLVLNVTCDDETKSIIDITQNIEYNKYEIIYQTEILSTIIDYLLTTNVCLNDNNSITNISIQNENRQNIFTNICYLNTRIVDKLWQKRLQKDFLDIFYYNIRLIDDLRRKSSNYTLFLDNLYHSLNRTVLFLVSRPYKTQEEQLTMLDNLEKLRKYEIIVFHGNNDEVEFFACLIYCLLHLINYKEASLDLADLKNYTVWHISNNNLIKNELNENISQLAMMILKQIYLLKKVLIDDIFKVNSLSMLTNQEFYIEDQVYEIALKYWQSFLESEKKVAMYKYPYEYYQKDKFNMKLNRVVSGGLNRLANRTKSKKDEQMQKKYLQITESKIDEYIMANVKLVRDFVHNRQNYYQIEMHYTHKYLYNIWLDIESDLIRERGLWGPETPNLYDKWLLDLIEGSCRMRKKLIRNHSFYLNYPYMPDQNHTSLKYRYATSFDSKNYYEALKAYQMQNLRNSIESIQNFQEDSLISASNNSNLTYNSQMSSIQTDCFDDYFDDINLDDNNEMSSIMLNNQFLLRLLEPNERIGFIFRCLRIEGLDHIEGLLIFGKEYCYIIDGFTILKNRELRDIDNLNTTHKFYEPILPESSTISGIITNQKNVKKCAKIFYEDIREVLKRRYLLQPMALEMFSNDGRNYLLAFPRNIRNEVYQKFKSLSHNSSVNSSQDSVSGQKRNINIEQVSNIFTTFMGETVVQRWIRGEISNFQYLMHLNSLAGRSYNDLMQYPIFPWVLSDYESEELDLTNPNSFRDLKKPMGAQTPERLEQFCKRYMEWDDPYGETPPYHYGTHYSSAMIVCSYLVRLEPFTQQFLRLQGGHFDLADRMFHSVQEAWLSASKNNMADVKELIPEFFYLPEFLKNSNNFDFGIKQNGVQLNDVILPPWAKDDPYEFIRLHRMALESDYVSQNLHHWIDLIFGYKQQGQMAIDSFNLFHHLFYEGNVDIYNIDDPLKKIATIGFINNFGQIPKQLFHKPHSAKKSMKNISFRSSSILDNPYLNSSNLSINEKVFYKNIDNLRPSTQPIKELKGSVGQIIPYEKTLFAIQENKCFIPPAFNKYISWGYADHSLRICNYDNGKTVLIHEMLPQSNEEIMVCVCPNSKTIITAGSGCYVSIYKYELKKRLVLKKNLFGHTECIVCLAANTSFNIIVSGSKDCTAIIWDLSRLTFIRQLLGHITSIAAISIQENTGNIATCSGTWLYIWDINGFKLASIDTSIGKEIRMQQILCVSFSYYNEWDTDNVIMTGSTDGVVKMWSMSLMKDSKIDSDHKIDVHWKRKLFFRSHLTMYTAYSRKDNTEPASITALAISKDHKIVYVGDARGRVYSWTISETPGRSAADHWCRDESVEFCVDCQIRFTIYERKHHCRSCGLVFCSKCTSYESKILRLNIFNDVRVCRKCFRSLNESHD